jgi:SAM-dependent methyltransferase
LAEHNTLYQNAVYYDIALSRDVTPEVDFLIAACHHYTGSNPQSVLDIACGPGYHAREFARRGIAAAGLDLRPEMLQLAREKAAEENLSVDWVVGDMRNFKLESPVHMAICMFDGIDALLRNEDFAQHFRAVAGNLMPGGLYVLEYTHPRECSLASYGKFHYAGERDGVKVEILWATNNPIFDPSTGVACVETEMRVEVNGNRLVIPDSACERLVTPQEIALLAELSGVLHVVGWHGDFDLDQPFDNSPASKRMIAVLQKT